MGTPLNKTDRMDSLGTITSIDQDLFDLFNEGGEIERKVAEETQKLNDYKDEITPEITPEITLDAPMSHEYNDKITPDVPISSSPLPKTIPVAAPEDDEGLLVEKLKSTLPTLPKAIQNSFIERLVATTNEPKVFKEYVNAIIALADAEKLLSRNNNPTKAKREAGTTATDSSRPLVEKREEALPLAAKFLTQYSSSLPFQEKK